MSLRTCCTWCATELLASQPIFIAYEPAFGMNTKIELCDHCAEVRAVMLRAARMIAVDQAATPEEAIAKIREAAGSHPI